MNIYVVIGILTVWFLFELIIKIKKTKKASYTIIVSFAFILAFLYFYLYDLIETENYNYYSYITIGVFILYLCIRNLKHVFRKNISEFDYYELESELEQLNYMTELLRKRFISTIELINDGICFKDEGELLFGTDRFINITGLESNQFDLETFESKIYKDDLPQYRIILEKTSKRHPVYTTTYRIQNNEGLIWIKEIGKKIYIDKKVSVISIIKPLETKQFPETEIDVLNGLPNYKKMYDEMQRLSRLKSPYYLVFIQLSNIPKINEKYGRDVGDLMMGEYLKKTRYNFIKDNQSLYRVGGINFGLIIKDEKKFELLDRALTGNGDLLNLRMVFGGITQTLYPNLGISESPYTGKSPDQVIEEASEALRISLKNTTDVNYCFFNRI
ncbi:MAG: diguanylate cyclase [Bacilli bacterium]|nr:diguanylate cyclase [Bacilli bacterium]